MNEHEFLNALKEDLPPGFGTRLKAELDALEAAPIRQAPPQKRRPFWMSIAAVLVVLLLGMWTISLQAPATDTLLLTQNLVPSFTQRGELNADTLGDLQPFARMGNGQAYNIIPTYDGESLLVIGSNGLFLHDTDDLNAEPITIPIQVQSGWLRTTAAIGKDHTIYALSNSDRDDEGENIIYRWNPQTQAVDEVLRFSESTYVLNIEVSPDGEELLVVQCDSNLPAAYPSIADFGYPCTGAKWQASWHDLANGEVIRELELDTVYPQISLSEDWSQVVYIQDFFVHLLNLNTGQEQAILEVTPGEDFLAGTWQRSLIMSRDGSQIIFTPYETWPNPQFWEVDRLLAADEPFKDTDEPDYVLETSPQFPFYIGLRHNMIIMGAAEQTHVYHLGQNNPLKPLVFDDSSLVLINAVFSPDGKTIYTLTQGDILRAWDAQSMEILQESTRYGSAYPEFTITEDGSTMLTFSPPWNSLIEIWDLTQDTPTREILRTDDGEPVLASQATLSRDGRFLAYIPFNRSMVSRPESNPMLQLLDRETGQQHNLAPVDAVISSYSSPFDQNLTFLPDGSLLESTSNALLLWTRETLQSEMPLFEHLGRNLSSQQGSYHPQNVVFTSDARFGVMRYCSPEVGLRCTKTYPVVQQLDPSGDTVLNPRIYYDEYTEQAVAFGSMALSPDDRLLFFGYCTELDQQTCLNGEVAIFDLSNMDALTDLEQGEAPIATISGLAALPSHIAVHPDPLEDGWMVAITEQDQQTKFWHVDAAGTTDMLYTLENAGKPVYFSPDGDLIFTSTSGAQIEVWAVPPVTTTP